METLSFTCMLPVRHKRTTLSVRVIKCDYDEGLHINRSPWRSSSICTRQPTQKHCIITVMLAVILSSAQRNAYVRLLSSLWRQSYWARIPRHCNTQFCST
jgi:hypothetical protein